MILIINMHDNLPYRGKLNPALYAEQRFLNCPWTQNTYFETQEGIAKVVESCENLHFKCFGVQIINNLLSCPTEYWRQREGNIRWKGNIPLPFKDT